MDEPQHRFLRACRRLPVDRTPVWFMRQAGRSLPEYRALRGVHNILTMCQDPALATEITLMPLRRMPVDAAILFSDIMIPLIGAGVKLEVRANVGPIIEQPIVDEASIRRIGPLIPEEGVPYVLETIRLLRRELQVPLIGFSGLPFTLASYLVEGKPSREFLKTKQMLFGAPELWAALMSRLAEIVVAYLRAQVAAGAQAVQLFDSWVGALGPDDYAAHVLPYTRQVVDGIRDLGVPVIHFGVHTAGLIEAMAEVGPDVIGLDWRVRLDQAWARAGGPERIAVQGNLDPGVLFAPWDAIAASADRVLSAAGGRPGHIFNLGHGVYPDTPLDNLVRLVDFVHEWTPVGASR